MSSVDNSIISNASLKFKIVKVYSDLENWQWKHSFTILQVNPITGKQFYKKFNKYMTNKFGPIDARWSYVKSTIDQFNISHQADVYFLLRFRTDADAAYFRLRQ